MALKNRKRGNRTGEIIMNYAFTFTEHEANLILRGLVALPYGEVAPLIANIHKQVNEQMSSKEESETKEPPQE